MIRGRIMKSICHLTVVVLAISSILFTGTSAEDTELDRLSHQPEASTEWNNEKLMADFQVLCNNGTLLTPGEFAPGVNLTTLVQTFRSVWRADALAEVAIIVCKRHGPLLNLISGGLVRTVCEPIIDAMNQNEPLNVEDTCYQLWDTFQRGSAISSVPSCPAWDFNDDYYDYWDDYGYPSDDNEAISDGHREHHGDPPNGDPHGHPWDDEEDGSKDGYPSGERDKPDVYPTGYPSEEDGFTEGYPYGSHNDDDKESYFHFDVWKIKQLMEAAFSFVGRGTDDFCFNITGIVFNESVTSFDVIDHALSALLMSKLEEVELNCGSAVEFLSPTGYGMDFTATFLSHISESLGTNDLCSALTSFRSPTFESEIISMAKMKIFDALKDFQACLDIYDTLSEFSEDISEVTGFDNGHQLCELIFEAFTSPAEVEELRLDFGDTYRQFDYYFYWEWPLYPGEILPGVSFHDAVSIAANVLNSDTASHGLSVVCRAFSNVMDYSTVEACNALNEANQGNFLMSCYSSNVWPDRDRDQEFPHFHGLDFLNNIFSTFHLLKEKASEFSPDIDRHVALSEFIPLNNSVSDVDGDVCSAVGNLLFNRGLTFGDILLPIIEKHLLFLYHIAPHYCQGPLDPGYQWPGQDYDDDHRDPWDGEKDDPNNGHKDSDETEATNETPWTWGPTEDSVISGNRKNNRAAKEVTENPFEWEATTMDQIYTTWDWGKPNHPGKDDHYYDYGPWCDVKIGILHGKLLKDILAALSGHRNSDEFCSSTIQKFEYNETAYRMEGRSKVFEMKEKLLGVLLDYDSCVSTFDNFRMNLTETEFYQMTGFWSSGSLCQAVLSAFTGGSLFGNINDFQWPIDYHDYDHYDGLPAKENQPGEIVPGVYLSTFIQFVGILYNAEIVEGTSMICYSFQHVLGYFETETCQFLERDPSQEEFVRFCNDHGHNNDGHGHDDDNNHHGNRGDDGYEKRHEGESIFAKLPWNELPSIVEDIWGATLESVPMCGLGWELYSEQPVKLTLRNAFRTLTRLVLYATAELWCDSDDYYTSDAFDYFYNHDYNFTAEYMESDNFLDLLYSFLGGYNSLRDLCHDNQSLSDISELMTGTLFKIVEDKDTCKSFLDTLSLSVGEDYTAGATVGQMACFGSNMDLCGNITNYMTGSFDFTFNSTAVVAHLGNIEEIDILSAELMDNILRVVAIIYRAENIEEISNTFCPILESAPQFDTNSMIMEACTFLLTANDATFDGSCTDTLQCYIPYFWLSLNSREDDFMLTDHRSNGYHFQYNYSWYDYRTNFDYHYDHYNDYGYHGDYGVFSHMSFESLGPIVSHVLGIPLLDSRVTCSGIDNWLQTSQGSEIFDSMFRFIQMLIISNSKNICPTIYHYGSERPHPQPDLQFGDTSFRDVIGAINQFLGDYSDYETLCWDAQMAYQDWQYFEDSTRLDSMLDEMFGRLIVALNDTDQCVEFADSMNRMPIYGPVAAWLGFETNEQLCQEVTYYFSHDRDNEVNVNFLLSFLQFEEDGNECWTTEMQLAVTEIIKLVTKVYHYEAVEILDQICEIAVEMGVNGTEITMICQRKGRSIVTPCLEIVSMYIENIPFFDDEYRGNQTSNWKYLEGVFSKLGQIFWRMYSHNGLGNQRLMRVVQYLQNTIHFGYFNLNEPYSGCSFLRRVLTANHSTLVKNATMILSYPIADLLEYSGSLGLCSVAADGGNSTDIVAYRLLKKVLVSISGMDQTHFCDFLGAQHSNEEYLAQGMVMGENLFNIVADENLCVSFVTVLVGEDMFHMLYNLTGMNLTLETERAAFCAHVVSSFSTDSSFSPEQYVMNSTGSLETWRPFSIPGQILPQFSFAEVTSLIGAIYKAPTLLDGAGILCDVFKNALLQEPEMQVVDIEGICYIVKAVDGATLEGLCLNLTVPSYYGWDYPVALRPVNTEFVVMSILLQLFGTTDLSTQNILCPAVDLLFNSEMNLPGIVDVIFHAWLRELLPTAAGFCSNWDEIVWYLSPERHAQIFDSLIGRYTNWTVGTSEETAMAQAMYEHTINTATNLLSTILDFDGRESMCQFIQSSVDHTTGQVHDEIIDEVKDKLFFVLYDADVCSYVVTSLLQLMERDLGMMHNDTFYTFTGFHRPDELCWVVTTYLSEEECPWQMDCFGVCNGTAQLDCEDECGGKATVDCAGDCRGDAFISNCTNECVGGTTRIPVTAGRDVCGMCTLDIGYESPLDCANVCFGTAVVDECGECSGGLTGVIFNAERIDCSGQCDGSAYLDCTNECITAGRIGLALDQCGVCGGNDECLGCDGEPNSGLENDACDVCGGPSLACVYGINLKATEAETENELLVYGNFNGELSHQCSLLAEDGTSSTFDMTVVNAQTGSCNISLGVGNYEFSVLLESSVAGTELSDGQSLTLEVWSACTESVDCEGVCGGSAVVDCFDVCGGSAVVDCDGICGGPLVNDCADVCGGDAVADCDGICNGATPVDCTGTCNGDAVEDCSGECQGSAFVNECGFCVGGNTGRSESLGYDPCDNCVTDPDYTDVRDCYGTCNGDAYVDDCGDCVGGASGLSSTAEDRTDCRGVCDGGWETDSCGYCEPPSAATVSIYADCNNDCHPPGNVDRAYINDCNQCVGGNTGLGDNHGFDACGICGGDNSTCTGCDGVVLSGAVEDACGECKGTGTSCQVISTIDQRLIQVGVEVEMTVFGAGFTTQEQYTCSLSGPEPVTSGMTVLLPTEGICTFTLPSAGGYEVSIIVNGEALSVQDEAELTVYAYSGISLTSIDPVYGLVSSESTTFTLSANSGAFAAVKTLGLTPYINIYLPGSSRVFSRVAASFSDDDDSTLSFNFTAARSAEATLVPFIPGIGELTTEGLPVVVYAPSPQLTNLYFDNRGSSIIAEFDSAAVATVLTSCSDVIVDTTSLGESPFCQWVSPYKLEIVVGSGSDLVSVGDTLVFDRQNIVALYETYPYPEEDGSTFEMTVSAPEVTPPVRVRLFGPSVISSCGMIKIQLQSQGAAGRELTNQWNVTSDGDTTLITAALESLTEKNLEVNGSLITADTSYTFHVTVTNFLGGSAEASLTLRRSSLPTPDLIISAFRVDTENALVSQRFTLQADVFFSDCVPPGATAYEWSVDDESVVLSLKRNSRRLVVAANSLPGGKTITFTVVAYKESDPSNTAQETIAITTQHSDLEAVISQGQHITVGQDSGLLNLDGSMSYDPDNVPVDATYEWQCEQQVPGSRNQITDNTACWSFKSGHAGEKILENADPTSATLTFDAAHLNADKIYVFTLVYRKSTRSATASIYVSPVAGAPPKVSITPLTNSVSSAAVLVLKANIEHSSTLSSIEWSTTDTDSGLYGYIDLTDASNFVSSPSVLPVSDTRTFCFMALDKDVLVPGSTYRFQLAVASEDNKTSDATIEVKVRNIVTSCVISLEDGSSSYTELETITISIDGCTTDEESYPLTYQLLIAGSDGTFTTMTTAESSDRISITGPAAELFADSTNYNIFAARVCDRYQSCSVVTLTLPVNAAVFTSDEVATVVETLISEPEQKQEYLTALSNLNIVEATVGDSLVNNVITTGTDRRRKRAADTTGSNSKRLELAGNTMATTDMGVEEAEVLMNQLKSYDVYSSSQTDLEILVDQYQESVDIYTQDGSAVPESSSDAILEQLEAMKALVPSSSGRIRGKISNLTEALVKSQLRALSLGGEERKTESISSKIVLKRDIPNGRMTFDSDFHFDVGEDIKNRFGSGWSCSSGSCDGVTFKYQAYNDSVDEFSQTEEDIANRVAAIIEITLFDPDSDEELTVSDLSEAACFNMSLTRTEDSSQYQCRYWDSTNSEWSDSGLTSEMVGSLLVTCCTYHLSTFTILLDDITTQSPTHTSQGTSSSGGDESSSTGSSGPQTTEENPPPAYRGNGAVVGIVVGVIVLVVIAAAVVGVGVFIKMKSGNNKIASDQNFEAGHAVPPPLPPPSASPQPADVSSSPSPRPPPVAFETAQPVAVPLRGEPNMPPPPSVFVPPGEEATVATEEEGKPRGDPHRPDRASDSESLNSAGSAMNETSDATGAMDYSPGHDDTQDSLPEPST